MHTYTHEAAVYPQFKVLCLPTTLDNPAGHPWSCTPGLLLGFARSFEEPSEESRVNNGLYQSRMGFAAFGCDVQEYRAALQSEVHTRHLRDSDLRSPLLAYVVQGGSTLRGLAFKSCQSESLTWTFTFMY